ncbi:MAG: glycosyltransferase family 39 protein [Ardenticatenaceae bacterium]|nr:glycosyltransferase family 39 protein [Ardenticatenaceae bacterium]MCB9446502.1 glycosyltransferase family 39 protein [Ardenticatenaceae bacterium]
MQKRITFNDTAVLVLLALVRLAVHLATNGQYGFHRDELAIIDDARFLAWGYVAYPPLTPFVGRLALELFGPSLVGIRFFAALAQSGAMVVTGLMARELGGTRRAQVLAALAAAIAPMSLIMGALFQYIAFDYLWWVLIAYLLIRLLKSDNPRWWLGLGAVIGLGMMTKYTLAVFVAGLIVGVIATPARKQLKSPWLWGGVALSLLIFLPNLIWQIQHDFISLEFLSDIHARDVAIGRTADFLPMQLIVSANPFTLPLWLAGLYFYFFAPDGKRYQALGWMYVSSLILFLILHGRFYYLTPAYPLLLAGGAVVGERWLARKSTRQAQWGWGVTGAALAAGAVLGGVLMLPIAPVNSAMWQMTSQVHDNFVEQIGWPELVATVANIYTDLPAEEQAVAGILTGNYGEAGAINLYSPAYGLPEVISGINSYWLRGYGNPPPQVLIVVGFSQAAAERYFIACDLAGQVSNRYGVENEETRFHPDIFVCRGLRQPWPELWPDLQSFG